MGLDMASSFLAKLKLVGRQHRGLSVSHALQELLPRLPIAVDLQCSGQGHRDHLESSLPASLCWLTQRTPCPRTGHASPASVLTRAAEFW
eukprot:scaffold48391_cov19-Tisochrysis_lutea.AAC.1